MRKRQNKNQLLTLVFSLILLNALLGTSYAYWTKSVVVETKIVSGKIGATGECVSESEYIMCVNAECASGDKHRQQPKIQIQLDQDSLPIEVRNVEILEFKYTAEIWSGTQSKEDKWKWDHSPTYTQVILTNDVKSIKCTYEKDENNLLTIGIGEQGKEDLEIKEAMREVWSENRPSDRPNWADVYVGEKGKLTLRITYTQFNTKNSGGWEKVMDVEVPVSWYRKHGGDSNLSNGVWPVMNSGIGNMSIKPGEEDKFKS